MDTRIDNHDCRFATGAGREWEPLFLLKGGVYLERRLGLNSRSTKDLDTLFRGMVDDFVASLDESLRLPWGEISFSRSEIETIDAPRLVKPRRFNVILSIKGRTWRRIQVEVSFPEGAIGDKSDRIIAPSIGYFGLEDVGEIAGISMAYQVAPKLHACSGEHHPPKFQNDRVRDIVDLILIRDEFYAHDVDLSEIRRASEDVFAARGAEAQELGLPPRSWPPIIATNDLWAATFAIPASEVGLALTLDEALAEITAWLDLITRA